MSVDELTAERLTLVEYCRHRICITPSLQKVVAPQEDFAARSINQESGSNVNAGTITDSLHAKCEYVAIQCLV